MDVEQRYRPRSLAVVGASPSSFVGRVALDNARTLGFGGRLVAVTPRYADVAGVPTVPSLCDLDEPVDTALVQVRADRVMQVVHEGIAAGVQTFVVPGAGATDSGVLAHQLVDDLREASAAHEISVIGPNCMGVVDLVGGSAAYIGTVGTHLRRGSVGVLAQSGAIVEAFVNAGPRVAMSTVISSGSEAVLTTADHLDFFAQDPHTDVVLAFIEAVEDGAALVAACHRLAEAGKQLAACVVGRSVKAREGVQAHSGKLAGGGRVIGAALRQSGVLLAHDLDELFAFGELLGTGRRPAGRRMHLVTNSGGEANLLSDLVEDAGLVLPELGAAGHDRLVGQWPLFTARNPMDPWGADRPEVIYPEVLEVLAAEDGDVLVVSIDQQRTAGEYEQELGLTLATALEKAARGSRAVPVVLSPAAQDPPDRLAAFCHAHRIPLLRGARPALAALAASAGSALSQPPRAMRPATIPTGRLPRTEDDVLAALASCGVDTPRVTRVADVDGAVAAARVLGGPVVLKGVAEGLLHKTELGLVRVGLVDSDGPGGVAAEAARMLSWAHTHDVALELLVAEQVRGDLEVLVGFSRDPVFGPTLLVGVGGIWAEQLDIVDVHVGHLDTLGAQEFLRTSRVGQLMAAARGGPLRADGVVVTLCAVSDLAAAHPSVGAIDVNPVVVGRVRAVAVDAALTLEPEGTRS